MFLSCRPVFLHRAACLLKHFFTYPRRRPRLREQFLRVFHHARHAAHWNTRSNALEAGFFIVSNPLQRPLRAFVSLLEALVFKPYTACRAGFRKCQMTNLHRGGSCKGPKRALQPFLLFASPRESLLIVVLLRLYRLSLLAVLAVLALMILCLRWHRLLLLCRLVPGCHQYLLDLPCLLYLPSLLALPLVLVVLRRLCRPWVLQVPQVLHCLLVLVVLHCPLVLLVQVMNGGSLNP
jgi:hypothetical protein